MRPNFPGIARFITTLAIIAVTLTGVYLTADPFYAVLFALIGVLWTGVFFIALDQSKHKDGQ